jgi:hypothetical protein
MSSKDASARSPSALGRGVSTRAGAAGCRHRPCLARRSYAPTFNGSLPMVAYRMPPALPVRVHSKSSFTAAGMASLAAPEGAGNGGPRPNAEVTTARRLGLNPPAGTGSGR